MHDCRSLPPYSGQWCWHSEGAPFVVYTSVEQNTQVILCENVCKTAAYTLYICISDKTNMSRLKCLVEYWFRQILEGDRKAIMLCSMALPSKLCAALHGQSNVGSMCDCKTCGSLDLSVLVWILSGVDSDHGTGPRRNHSVNSASTLCPIERRSCWPKTLLLALIWLITFVNWAISSWPRKPQKFNSL